MAASQSYRKCAIDPCRHEPWADLTNKLPPEVAAQTGHLPAVPGGEAVHPREHRAPTAAVQRDLLQLSRKEPARRRLLTRRREALVLSARLGPHQTAGQSRANAVLALVRVGPAPQTAEQRARSPAEDSQRGNHLHLQTRIQRSE